MEALVFDTPTTTDSKELADYKARVLKEAQKLKTSKGGCWFEDTMKKLDIAVVPTQATVQVTTSHPFEFVVKINPEDYQGKTADEQRDALTGLVNGLLAKQTGGLKMKVPASSIVSAVMLSKATTPEGTEVISGDTYIWRYSNGSSARTMHLWREQDTTGMRYLYSACSQQEAEGRNLAARSTRGTGNHCTKCEAVAAANP